MNTEHPNETWAELDARRGALVKELAEMQSFCRGRLHEVYKTCGKAGCRCGKDPAQRHGPYYAWVRQVDGVPVQRTLRAEQAAHVREGIARYEAYEQVRDAYEETMERAHLAAFEVLETGAAVKKTAEKAQDSSGTRRTSGRKRGSRHADATSKRSSRRRTPSR